MALCKGTGSEKVKFFASKCEEAAQAQRLADGIDPDEHTIYNVLCPEIRKSWSPMTHRIRAGKPKNHVWFTIPEVELLEPESLEERHYKNLDY
jgi:hypothetical protein